MIGQTVLVTLVSTVDQRAQARLLVDSVRSFGGALSHCRIWVFEADPQGVPCGSLEDADTRVFSLGVSPTVQHYWFAGKVSACARAEEMADPGVQSLVWLSPDNLVIQPPVLFVLSPEVDAAVRPVHVKNVGLLTTDPLDGFWKKVYETVGLEDVTIAVESFVDAQRLRAYFNSHALAVDPARGLFRRWLACFETLVCDDAYQADSCPDPLHQIFLHQAVLSALLVADLDFQRVRVLPPAYNYPYNLHGRVPLDRRAQALDDLVSIAYEDRPLDPAVVDDIDIREPLRSWLAARAGAAADG